MKPKVCFVIPCYNEEEVLPETISRLTAIIQNLVSSNQISPQSTMLFVDDGSKDKTWSIIEFNHKINNYVKGLKLARNAGHQNALFAGLMKGKEIADCVISLDADLQDDLGVLEEFIKKYTEGYEIVYGIRKSRKTDTFFKRRTALAFYKLMQTLGVNIKYNHADYRLMSKRALDYLEQFKEVNLFLRGIIPLIGLKSTDVYYDRAERFAGESKYPLKKMLSFAMDGITSFSIKPIRIISTVGASLSLLSIVAAAYTIISMLLGRTASGWASLMISLWFIGGIQLICLGLIGEYIGKIYQETKHRPRYFLETELLGNEVSSMSAQSEQKPEPIYR